MTIAKIFRVAGKTVDVKSRLWRSFNSHDDDNNNIKKQLVLWAKQLLTRYWRPLYDYDAKSPNATFFGELEHTNFLSLFLNLDKFLKNSTPGEISYIWQIERVQIDAIKFKRTEIYFLATEPRTANKKNRIRMTKEQHCGASRFFVHFFAVTGHYNVKLPNFTFYGGREHMTTIFFFVNLDTVL